MWHCNDSPSLRLVVLCMTDKSFVIFWTSVKMINGGMMPAGGAINIFSTLFWPIHYSRGFNADKHMSKPVLFHKKNNPSWHFHGRHKLAAKTSAVWRSGSLVTHLVPHEGMPIVCKTAKTHWRKKMKKKNMKLNELSALQRKINGKLQHVGTLLRHLKILSTFFVYITNKEFNYFIWDELACSPIFLFYFKLAFITLHQVLNCVILFVRW